MQDKMTNEKNKKSLKIEMNNLERGLILLGLVGTLAYAGLAVSDAVKLYHGKKESNATSPVGATSTFCYIVGLARTGYEKIKYLKEKK